MTWYKPWTWGEDNSPKQTIPTPQENARKAPEPKDRIDDRPKIITTPTTGRSSEPDYDGINGDLSTMYATINYPFIKEIIPVLRKLAYSNNDVALALHNIVSLGNTGHKVYFDRKVPESQVDKMRNHLVNVRKKWAPGQAGMDGLVNKLFSQIMISGALSAEPVVNNELTGIRSIFLIDPENIEFKLRDDRITYQPYQRIKRSLLENRKRIDGDLVKLNTETYQYLAFNGDGESPYGIPPFMPVIGRVESQQKMETNIDFIVDIMGLVGFLEVLIQKPDEDGDNNDKAYKAKLDTLLNEAKSSIMGGIKDGVVVGYKDDHEFKFNSAGEGYKGVSDIYKLNEQSIATALKQDPALWGRDYGTSEAKANVMFIKMLSELKNIQNIVKIFLEFVYNLELRLVGFNFEYLTVAFNRSTLQDDYKYQQAEDLKIKNVLQKVLMGTISFEQAADELGYESPHGKPLVSIELLAGKTPKSEEGTQHRKTQKKKVAKSGRDNKKKVTKDYK